MWSRAGLAGLWADRQSPGVGHNARGHSFRRRGRMAGTDTESRLQAGAPMDGLWTTCFGSRVGGRRMAAETAALRGG